MKDKRVTIEDVESIKKLFSDFVIEGKPTYLPIWDNRTVFIKSNTGIFTAAFINRLIENGYTDFYFSSGSVTVYGQY